MKGLKGTMEFCSINTLFLVKQTRRDDLESLCYVLAYALDNRRLPWYSEDVDRARLKQLGKDLHQVRVERSILRRGMSHKIVRRSLPQELRIFFEYVYEL